MVGSDEQRKVLDNVVLQKWSERNFLTEHKNVFSAFVISVNKRIVMFLNIELVC